MIFRVRRWPDKGAVARTFKHAKGVAVVTSKRGEQRHSGTKLATQLLAAACLAATMGLAACDSPVAEATKKAKQDSNKAARIAQSAGEARPKDAFTNAFANKDAAEQKKAGADIEAKIKADHLNAKAHSQRAGD